eukprot:jgi/Chrzof1/471/Cz01g17010.t1
MQGLDRGIFGVQAAKHQAVVHLIEAMEAVNPLHAPVNHLDRVQGDWRLLYTTIHITGSKKTKLGLREFVKLGEFIQTIDINNQLAVNEIQFSVAGLGLITGALTIKASYQPASVNRVSIQFREATLVPKQLQQIFEQNFDLLLSIFNPDGWLDLTYVDEELRVGRDDKGNIFVLERC